MITHHFTLVVEGPDLQSEDLTEALFEAGCGDALVGRVDDTQYMDFDRESPTLEEAIISAVADVESVEGVEVVRLADAGLVSMSEIAGRMGRTRESVRLLIAGSRGPGGFPAPANDPRDRYRLWRWLDVERWIATDLEERRGQTDDHAAAAINAVLEFRHHGRHMEPGQRTRLRELAGL